MGRKRRLLMLGLDGYEAAVAEQLMSDGRLPNLRYLRDTSARYELDHGPEKFSGLTWEHLSTGQAPGMGGRWSAIELDTGNYEVLQFPTERPPFLTLLPAKSVVFDVPYFDLAQAPEVLGVVGWGAHDAGVDPQYRPSELRQEIEARFGGFVGDESMYGFSWPSPARTTRHGRNLLDAVRQRSDVVTWLLTERISEWDLAVVVTGELHSAIEPFWHGMDSKHPLHALPSAGPAREALLAVYEEVDRFVGRITSAVPEAEVLAFAMHGMGRNESDIPSLVLLPELLYRHQFGEALLHPRADWTVGSIPSLGEEERWSAAVIEQLRHRSSPWRALRRRLRLAPEPRIDADRRTKGSEVDWIPGAHYRRYWPDMDAFSIPGYYHGRVRVNLQGRESRGRVALADYDRVCEEIANLIGECRDPSNGAPVARTVERFAVRDPLSLLDTDADLDVIWEGNPIAFEHPELGIIGPVPHRRTGGHTGAHGFAWLSGSAFEPGDRGVRSSFDVVPTVFDALGHQIPGGVTGRSLLESKGDGAD